MKARPVSGALVVSLLLLLAFAFGYLWVGAQCDGIGRRIKGLEREKEAVHRRVVNEELKWSNLTTYESLSRLLKQHHIEMDWPKQHQIVRLRRAPQTAGGTVEEEGAFARN